MKGLTLLKIEVGKLADRDRMMSDGRGRCRHDSISPACQFFRPKSDTLHISIDSLQFSCQRTYHLTSEHASIRSPSKVHICIFHRISDMLQKSLSDVHNICPCTHHFMVEHISIKSPYKLHTCIITYIQSLVSAGYKITINCYEIEWFLCSDEGTCIYVF